MNASVCTCVAHLCVQAHSTPNVYRNQRSTERVSRATTPGIGELRAGHFHVSGSSSGVTSDLPQSCDGSDMCMAVPWPRPSQHPFLPGGGGGMYLPPPQLPSQSWASRALGAHSLGTVGYPCVREEGVGIPGSRAGQRGSSVSQGSPVGDC